MKTINLFINVIAFALISCNSGENSNAQKVNFGIYETFRVKDIPNSVIDNLKTTNIKFEKDTQLPIIGYFQKSDTVQFQVDFSQENIQLVKTVNLIDKEGKYYALVAIKKNSGISLSDLKRTKNIGKNIEIHFNMTGAKKWAEMTKNNQGNMVAFIIDNQIYTMPYINEEINNGCAIINSLENEALAKNLSKSINSSITK